MGICRFCGQEAGLFKSVHKECESAHLNGKNSIVDKVSQAITTSANFSNLDTEIANIGRSSFVSKDELDELYYLGFDKAVESILGDGLISIEEEQKILNFKKHFNLDENTLSNRDSFQKILKALILRDILDGRTPGSRLDIAGTIPFLLQKDEKIFWLFQNVEFYERQTKTTFQGRSQGVSIKIAKGLYYRTGIFKGNPVTNEQMTLLGKGMLALTNENLYFASTTKSLKIPYNKLISITPFLDGIGLQKDGVSSKPQIFKDIDGWFTYNLISNLNKL